jgi:hypothetical protein
MVVSSNFKKCQFYTVLFDKTFVYDEVIELNLKITDIYARVKGQ